MCQSKCHGYQPFVWGQRGVWADRSWISQQQQQLLYGCSLSQWMIGRPETPTQKSIHPLGREAHFFHLLYNHKCLQTTFSLHIENIFRHQTLLFMFGSNLYSPDLWEFVQWQFTSQQLDDSLNPLTVLSLINVTWNKLNMRTIRLKLKAKQMSLCSCFRFTYVVTMLNRTSGLFYFF